MIRYKRSRWQKLVFNAEFSVQPQTSRQFLLYFIMQISLSIHNHLIFAITLTTRLYYFHFIPFIILVQGASCK